jgi:alkylation response protein AidB-like acyl-CoA dehydrogenase
MIEWNEMHLSVRDAMRRFIAAEVVPHLDELEHGGLPPYDILRKLSKTFGIADLARTRFAKQIAKLKEREASGEPAAPSKPPGPSAEAAMEVAMRLITTIELCRYSPGMVTAMGVSVGLTAAAINSRGTTRQRERWALPLMTMETIGAWAITEPDSGSDAFGAMRSTARREGDGYVLNGSKTFITNGPYADTIVFICKLDEPDVAAKDRKIVSFVLDKGMPGLTQSKPLRKMGLHGSPTGELFVADLRADKERLIGETEQQPARSSAKETFTMERTGVAAMALGIVEECRKLSLEYARTRVQFGKPIGEFQLIQDKLARMEIARMNLQNLVFRQIELAGEGKSMSLAEASACKLYAARAAMEVALEAVQLHGGNGYMAEYRVEQLCRDAKVLQIYGGTDEIQISQIARSLLAP